jgi:hypothetical protein
LEPAERADAVQQPPSPAAFFIDASWRRRLIHRQKAKLGFGRFIGQLR